MKKCIEMKVGYVAVSPKGVCVENHDMIYAAIINLPFPTPLPLRSPHEQVRQSSSSSFRNLSVFVKADLCLGGLTLRRRRTHRHGLCRGCRISRGSSRTRSRGRGRLNSRRLLSDVNRVLGCHGLVLLDDGPLLLHDNNGTHASRLARVLDA